MTERLTEKNFLIYAAKYYDNPQCHSTDEFLEDLNRIKYIKKLLTRYEDTGELKERLILNHFIVLSNLFPVEPLNKILYLKMRNQFSLVKPFLVLLNVLQQRIYNVENDKVIDTDSIVMNQDIVEKLRRI